MKYILYFGAKRTSHPQPGRYVYMAMPESLDTAGENLPLQQYNTRDEVQNAMNDHVDFLNSPQGLTDAIHVLQGYWSIHRGSVAYDATQVATIDSAIAAMQNALPLANGIIERRKILEDLAKIVRGKLVLLDVPQAMKTKLEEQMVTERSLQAYTQNIQSTIRTKQDLNQGQIDTICDTALCVDLGLDRMNINQHLQTVRDTRTEIKNRIPGIIQAAPNMVDTLASMKMYANSAKIWNALSNTTQTKLNDLSKDGKLLIQEMSRLPDVEQVIKNQLEIQKSVAHKNEYENRNTQAVMNVDTKVGKQAVIHQDNVQKAADNSVNSASQLFGEMIDHDHLDTAEKVKIREVRDRLKKNAMYGDFAVIEGLQPSKYTNQNVQGKPVHSNLTVKNYEVFVPGQILLRDMSQAAHAPIYSIETGTHRANDLLRDFVTGMQPVANSVYLSDTEKQNAYSVGQNNALGFNNVRTLVEQEMDAIFHRGTGLIDQIKTEAEGVFQNHRPTLGTDEAWNKFSDFAFEHIAREFGTSIHNSLLLIERALSEGNFDRAAVEVEHLQNKLYDLKNQYNFAHVQSPWAVMNDKQQEEFDIYDKGLKSMEKNEYFDHPDKTRFETEFVDTTKYFVTELAKFEDTMERLRTRVARDQNKSDEEFYRIYMMNKLDMKHYLSDPRTKQGMQQKIEQLKKETSAYTADPEAYIQQWQTEYNGNPEQRKQALYDRQIWQSLVDDTGKVLHESNSKFQAMLDEYDTIEKAAGKGKLAVRRMSLSDIFFTLKKVLVEAPKAKDEFNDKMARAYLAHKLNPNDSTIANEYYGSLGEERKGVKDLNEGLSSPLLWGEVENLKPHEWNKMRAYIELIIDNGDFAFDDPRFWALLSKVNPSFVFPASKRNELDYPEIEAIIKEQIINIWGITTYNGWHGSIPSQKSKNAKDYESEFSQFQNNPHDALAPMLEKWKAGKIDKDQLKYEAFLIRAIEMYNMKGTPHPGIYYIIMGLTVENPAGQTLLSMDIMDKVQDLHPYMKFFTDMKSAKGNNGTVAGPLPKALELGGAKNRRWNRSDLMIWKDMLGDGGGMFNAVMSPDTKKRLKKFHYTHILASKEVTDKIGDIPVNPKQKHWTFSMMKAEAWQPSKLLQTIKSTTSGDGSYFGIENIENIMSQAPTYFENIYAQIQAKDELYGKDPQWLAQRKEDLQLIGEKLRSIMQLQQSIIGNRLEDNAVISRKSYTDGVNMPLQGTCEKFKQGMMTDFFEQTGRKTKYEKLIEPGGFEGNTVGNTVSQIKNSHMKSVAAEVNKLNQDLAVDPVFTDVNAIEKFLQKQYSARGVSRNVFDQNIQRAA